jgi:hypothetical protein
LERAKQAYGTEKWELALNLSRESIHSTLAVREIIEKEERWITLIAIAAFAAMIMTYCLKLPTPLYEFLYRFWHITAVVMSSNAVI